MHFLNALSMVVPASPLDRVGGVRDLISHRSNLALEVLRASNQKFGPTVVFTLLFITHFL